MNSKVQTKQIIADRYTLTRRLGVGSIGTTWLAHDSIRDQEMVLKIIHEDLVKQAGGLSGIAKVLRWTCSIRHPSLVSVFDLATNDGLIYLSMERLTGESLRSRLQSHTQEKPTELTLSEIATIMATITSVIQEGSKLGLPHAGIKPDNIFIQSPDRIRITEYGVHNLLHPETLKSSAALLHVSHYLAPEFYEQEIEPSACTDQFALGAIWIELLERITKSDRNNEFERHQTFAAHLTAPNPKDRFQDLEELGSALIPLQSRHKVFTQSSAALSPSTNYLGKGILIAIGIALAFFVGINMRQKYRPNSAGLLGRAELKKQVRQLDQTRMSLLARGLAHPALQTPFLQEFKGDESFELIEEFYEKATTRSEKNLGNHIRQRLTRLRHKLDIGTRFTNAYDAAQQWQQELYEFAPDQIPNANHWQAELQTALEEALEQLGQGLFERATTGIESTLKDLALEFEEQRQEALDFLLKKQQKWARLLADTNTPFAEPNHDLSSEINVFTTEKNSHSVGILAKAYSLANTYSVWQAEWEQMPSKSPDQFQNSLGMIFQKIGKLKVSIFETRVIDYFHFVAESGFDDNRTWRDEAALSGPSHPVTSVSRYGAARFCEWLTKRDQKRGLIAPTEVYRLPTDLEWSHIAGLHEEEGSSLRDRHLFRQKNYPWIAGEQEYSKYGNYYTPTSETAENHFNGHTDRYYRTAPVGRFPPNHHGLYDLGGNAMEWVSTPYHPEPEKSTERNFTLRGAGWRTVNPEQMQIGYRLHAPSSLIESGFRCVLAPIEPVSR